MKKKYVTPEMDITEFENEDVITDSSSASGEEGGYDPFDPDEDF